MTGRRIRYATRLQLLLVLGIGQTALGASWLFVAPTGGRERGFQWLAIVEPQYFGLAMMVTGTFALIAVILSKVKSHLAARCEQIGFAAIFLPFALLAVIFLSSWLFGHNTTGWISAISYGTFSWLTFAAARVVNPPPILDSGPITLPTVSGPTATRVETTHPRHAKESDAGEGVNG